MGALKNSKKVTCVKFLTCQIVSEVREIVPAENGGAQKVEALGQQGNVAYFYNFGKSFFFPPCWAGNTDNSLVLVYLYVLHLARASYQFIFTNTLKLFPG